jgi:hypothetical protein
MLRKLARPCELPAVECRRTALPRDPERPSIEVRDSEAGTLRFQTAHVLLLPRRGNDPQRRSLAPPLISGPGYCRLSGEAKCSLSRPCGVSAWKLGGVELCKPRRDDAYNAGAPAPAQRAYRSPRRAVASLPHQLGCQLSPTLSGIPLLACGIYPHRYQRWP